MQKFVLLTCVGLLELDYTFSKHENRTFPFLGGERVCFQKPSEAKLVKILNINIGGHPAPAPNHTGFGDRFPTF
jgi:hypothetical protein